MESSVIPFSSSLGYGGEIVAPINGVNTYRLLHSVPCRSSSSLSKDQKQRVLVAPKSYRERDYEDSSRQFTTSYAPRPPPSQSLIPCNMADAKRKAWEDTIRPLPIPFSPVWTLSSKMNWNVLKRREGRRVLVSVVLVQHFAFAFSNG